jgi:hypothetical protein
MTCCDGFNASIGVTSCGTGATVCATLLERRLAYQYVENGITRRQVPSNLPYDNGAPPEKVVLTLQELIDNAGAELPTMSCGPAMRLTPSAARESGSVWYRRKVNVREGFDTTFSFRISNPSVRCNIMDDVNTYCRSRGADGLAFVIQNVSAVALGEAGNGMGYAGIFNSLAVELDTFFNYDQMDYYENHIAVMTQVPFPLPLFSLFSLSHTHTHSPPLSVPMSLSLSLSLSPSLCPHLSLSLSATPLLSHHRVACTTFLLTTPAPLPRLLVCRTSQTEFTKFASNTIQTLMKMLSHTPPSRPTASPLGSSRMLTSCMVGTATGAPASGCSMSMWTTCTRPSSPRHSTSRRHWILMKAGCSLASRRQLEMPIGKSMICCPGSSLLFTWTATTILQLR